MAIFTIRNAKDLGLSIKERRTALGLDQVSLAQKVGVSRKWIIDIEKGKPRASVELALRTLSVLGIQFTTDDEATKGGSNPKIAASSPINIDDMLDDLQRGDA